MRKYLYLAMAAASATVIAAPIVAQAAPAAHPHVLTVKKAGGPAVKKGDVLKASLKKGTGAVFVIKGLATITCKTSSFTAKVVTNPVGPGKATAKQTGETMSNCTLNPPLATVKKITALNLPYNISVSDAKGFPVKVSGQSKSKPIKLTATAMIGTAKLTCTYQAASIAGKASNKGNTVTITNQAFTPVKGSNSACGKGATFSATYGPVKDTSVKGNPAVFVN